MVKLLTSASCAAILIALKTQAATITVGDGIVYPANGLEGGQIDAGRSGNGSVTINGGDIVTLESGTSSVEFEARPKIDVGDGGVGTVTVTGLGTTVNLDGTNSGSKLEVGTFVGNSGTLEVLDGATINMTDDGPISGDDNENVFLQFGEDQADGTLIMDNGTINATGHSRIGLMVGVHGNTPIAGNGVIDMTNSTIDMTNLTTTRESFIIVGDQSNGTGDIGMVNSDISLVTPNGSTYVGLGTDGGDGNISLSSGSNFEVVADGLEVEIGQGSGSSGTITVGTNSTTTFESTGSVELDIGRSPGSTGSVTVESTGEFTVRGTSGRVQIGSDSSTTETGSGTLNVHGLFDSDVGVQVGSAFSGTNNQTGEVVMTDGVLRAPEVVVGTGGSITGTGTIDAVQTVLSGGSISAGFSPGILEFTGDLELRSGSLLFEIGGTAPSLFDSILVGGTLFATDVFDVQISFIDGFLPSETDSFELFSANSIESSFFSFANFASDSPFSFENNNGSLSLNFTQVSPVPIPAGLPLLLTALGATVVLRGRRKTQVCRS
ncbi:VPLPA-CTERM protein sorting domain-containing protein [Ruegeria halocynthiae]|uniref:VPLPA-CTERM protein sorting domain-containing protein n=1 Tax=Ruegeria halocynthiae TaxID=985054 RepID=A0A1H3AMY4_9RHOB|nr:VPLPA-CTERM sorting domain-containing protein [Ruegeria halocynthiae]SDX30791.1 VPLPA-CTERM protein sorting domain-containing protein [Ruegeria halocynthiae]